MKNTNKLKFLIIYMGDVLSVYAAFFLAMLFIGKYEGLKETGQITACLLALFVIYNIVFFLARYYRDSIFNFDSFSAVTIGACQLLIFALLALFSSVTMMYISISSLLLALIISCFLCGSYRVVIITGSKTVMKYANGRNEMNTIIFGAGEAGKFLANMLAFDKEKRIKIRAFIDDDEKLHGRKIKGHPVAGGRDSIAEAVKKYKADQIILAIPHVDNSNFREIVELCCRTGCKVRRFANMSDLNINDLSKATINDINIEDLLGREQVKLDLKGVCDLLSNKTVLVTGGAGSIGSEICRQVLTYDVNRVIVLDMNENGLYKIGNELKEKHSGKFVTVIGNITNKTRLDEIIEEYKPNIIFHAAAYKHVPMMESNPVEAVANNVFGTETLMNCAIRHNVESLTLISTDKAVNPTNIMGATKRITELMCRYMSMKNTNTKFAVVRFGNVLGSNGSVIPIFKEQIRKGGPVTVTDREIQRYFMTIPEAVQLVLEASSISKGGELFVLDMGTMIKIYDLATTMIRLSGLEPEKDIKIEISGLRPGEKMYEELRMDTEKLARTTNDRIFIFNSDRVNPYEFEAKLLKLENSIKKREIKLILEQIKALVPTYTYSDYIKVTFLNDKKPEKDDIVPDYEDDRESVKAYSAS